MTPVQYILEWVNKNAFNIESQSAGVVTAIDVEEFRKQIDRWMIYENVIMGKTYARGLYYGMYGGENTTCLVENKDELFGHDITYPVTGCCGTGPITDEKYCPECGKKIVRE